MSSTTMRGQVNDMAAVFINPRSLALGAEYEVLQFLVVERTLLRVCALLFDTKDSLPGCWGDQGSCELALRRTGRS